MASGESFAANDRSQTQNQPREADAAALDKLRVDLYNQGSGALFNKIVNDMTSPTHDKSVPQIELYQGEYRLLSDSSNPGGADNAPKGSSDSNNGKQVDAAPNGGTTPDHVRNDAAPNGGTTPDHVRNDAAKNGTGPERIQDDALPKGKVGPDRKQDDALPKGKVGPDRKQDDASPVRK